MATPKGGDDKAAKPSRQQTLTAKQNLSGIHQPDLALPEVDGGEHLVDYLFEVGPAIAGEPLTFCEIAAWSGLTGVVLSGWEAKTLRRLSSAYLGELEAAKDPARPAPA